MPSTPISFSESFSSSSLKGLMIAATRTKRFLPLWSCGPPSQAACPGQRAGVRVGIAPALAFRATAAPTPSSVAISEVASTLVDRGVDLRGERVAAAELRRKLATERHLVRAAGPARGIPQARAQEGARAVEEAALHAHADRQQRGLPARGQALEQRGVHGELRPAADP